MNETNELAPIVLFTYNRLEETKKTISALQINHLAKQTDLIIFSDGGKNENSWNKVNLVRSYIETVKGFKSVTIHKAEQNMGLASSIINGVTKVVEKRNKVIVLEDDLITSPNFLDFMNQSLSFFEEDMNVFSVSGYSMDLPSLPIEEDYYFGLRASSWGWGVWKNRWEKVDWEMKSYEAFMKNRSLRKKFLRGGSDMVKMLKDQKKNQIDSWAIRFCFSQFNQGLYTVFPSRSKIYSIGFSKEATHTSYTKRFYTEIDNTNQREFVFEKFEELDPVLVNEFKDKFSIKNRVKDKFGGIWRRIIQN